jgi:hypothetical protein
MSNIYPSLMAQDSDGTAEAVELQKLTGKMRVFFSAATYVGIAKFMAL